MGLGLQVLRGHKCMVSIRGCTVGVSVPLWDGSSVGVRVGVLVGSKDGAHVGMPLGWLALHLAF